MLRLRAWNATKKIIKIKPIKEICVVCYDEEATHTCIPCAHQVLCHKCAKRFIGYFDKCPICRMKFRWLPETK